MQSFFSQDIQEKVAHLMGVALEKHVLIATAESCTGGLLAACLTDIAGSSQIFDRGFITYSNTSKMAQLGVERKTLSDFGAVSAEVALEMAGGALAASHAHLAISITGIAGPDGGTDEKPVGLVYIGLASRHDVSDDIAVVKKNFTGTRAEIRAATLLAALDVLKEGLYKYNVA